ncbi:proline racemase family protein [Roseateles koreensis]|uniref:Proline racemase family protein n=1 Tax=Roseateles koreensis TaxID=2987526 RepID=A0ABT5KNS4_9BURK|nr:proline racemase family protein [Roseateles koreensis]MDC8784577.1 proline racemase family protein [Roseateles koreensis]
MRIIDSHTGGEPTRLIIEGGPDLGPGTMAERLTVLRDQHDHWRRALVLEPRGNDVIVGALLCTPQDAANTCGVIFFNNAGYLGMCGHGSIGLIASLAHLGRIGPGLHRIETPVGVISAVLAEDGVVSIANVPSFREAKSVAVEVTGYGIVHGDIAWGGNWFFLCEDHGLCIEPSQIDQLTERAWQIRLALGRAGWSKVDHIELIAPSRNPAHDPARSARNFVLCPGKAYDRSPCGTGTSAKLACLAADGKLAPGEAWMQESVIGSCFTGSYQHGDKGHVLPRIEGRAHVTLDAQVVVQADDPFAWGLPA